MLAIMQDRKQDNKNKNPVPIHFVISKWDIVEGHYTLDQIREKLLQIDEFRNIVTSRNQHNNPVHLIPVSSVGMGFAELKSDGTMVKTGICWPKPYQVEMPLACILPDMIQITLQELIRKKEQEQNQEIKVDPNISFWDIIKQFAGGGVKVLVKSVQEMLPRKYQFADNLLEEIVNVMDNLERPIYEKKQAAARRVEELRIKQEKSLKAVESQETALNHVVTSFLSIVNKLDREYPHSNLKL